MRRPREAARIKPFGEMEPVPIGIAFLSLMAVLLLLSFNLDRLPFTQVPATRRRSPARRDYAAATAS